MIMKFENYWLRVFRVYNLGEAAYNRARLNNPVIKFDRLPRAERMRWVQMFL